MADKPDPVDGDEPDPKDGDELDSEGEGSGDEPVETLDEIKAERDEYKRRLDKQRTAKAREARAANRKGGEAKPKSDDDDAAATALAEANTRIAELEAKNNETQAINIANELGFVKPAGAVALAKLNELVDPSDADEVRAALREVAKEYPMLKKPPAKADGGEGQGEGQGTRRNFNDMIRRAAGRG